MFNAANHNLLVEVLLEGRNPYSADSLSDAETRALRKALPAGETVLALLRGVTPRSGQTVWALTASRVWMVQAGWRNQPRSMAASSVRKVDLVRGKYGVTIGLDNGSERCSVFGADRALAMVFAQAVCQCSGASLSTHKIDALTAQEAHQAQGLTQQAAALLAA